MPTQARKAGRVETARRTRAKTAGVSVYAWRAFRLCFDEDIREQIDKLEITGVSVRDVQLLTSAVLLDCLKRDVGPQRVQACLKLLERIGKWEAEHGGGGEDDRHVTVPEGTRAQLKVVPEDDDGDELTA